MLTTAQFAMDAYKNRFGECDAAGVCALSTTRQSAVTGLLSLGATFGAVCSGYVSNKVRFPFMAFVSQLFLLFPAFRDLGHR